MGNASGFIFQAENEPTIFWIGDSIWNNNAADVIDKFQPDIIITHSCGAVWTDDKVLIVMDAKQTVEVCKAAPDAKVIATHMEAVDHATITRADLRACANEAGIKTSQLLIPLDGEIITQIHSD